MEQCAHQGDTGRAKSVSLTCNTPIIGRMVEIIRDIGSFQENRSTLCEVIVIGRRYIGKFLTVTGVYLLNEILHSLI